MAGMDVNRRNFIKGLTAGATGTALGAGLLVRGADADTRSGGNSDTAAQPTAYPFHGAHQAGVFTPQQRAAAFVAFDVTAGNATQLAELFQTLTTRVRLLTAGGQPVDLGIGSPPADSDVLGPVIPADALTVTVSVGNSLFDKRFGLASQAPKKLTPMRTFPNDALEPAWCHGDLMLQLCANNVDTVHHALRDIAKHTRGGMQMRYRLNGFVSPPRPAGTPRNLLGFKDGIANPTSADANKLIWVTAAQGEPAWAVGGSYQVVRLIRMLVEFWDRVSLDEQEKMFGRKRDSGAPLDGSGEFDTPKYAQDPKGDVIPLDAHIRLANPRTADSDPSRILRRGYNYDRGVDLNGNLDVGLIFACYQQDLKRQFEAVQTRLKDEPLVDYIQPYGGGYFYALPGIADANDWYGRALLG
jgi:deferrochelatase/peroxidase EfeB